VCGICVAIAAFQRVVNLPMRSPRIPASFPRGREGGRVAATPGEPVMSAPLAGAARQLASEWDETAASLDRSAAHAAERGAAPFRTDQMAARAEALRDCAQKLRSAIDAEVWCGDHGNCVNGPAGHLWQPDCADTP
jgi:hypothetical protein